MIILALFSSLASASTICGAYFLSPKVVIVSGTDRPGSNTFNITRQVQDILKARGQDSTLLNLAEIDKAWFNAEYFKPHADFKARFISKISEADAVLFVFPEYYGDIPGILKMFIDYVNPMSAFTSKPIGMISNSDGVLGGQKGAETLSGIMRHRKADVIGEAYVMIPEISKKLVDSRIADAALIQRIDVALQALVRRASTKFQVQEQMNSFLDTAISARIPISAALNSRVDLMGIVSNVEYDSRGFPISITIKGAAAILDEGKTISYQLVARQAYGLFAPIWQVKTAKGTKSLSDYNTVEKLAEIGLVEREPVKLTYVSGYEIQGTLAKAHFSGDKLQVLTLNNVTILKDGQPTQKHVIDVYDLPVGENILGVTSHK